MRKNKWLVLLCAWLFGILAAPCYSFSGAQDIKEAISNKDWDKVIEEAVRWKEKEKTQAAPYFILAHAYYAKGSYEKIPRLLDFIDTDEKKGSLLLWAEEFVREYPQSSLAHLLKADVCVRLKNNDEAIKEFEAAQELEPGFSLAYALKGMFFVFQNSYELAISNFTKAIELEGGLADSYNNRGIVYYCQGNYALALNDFSEAIKINPGFSPAFLGRGSIYYSLGKYDLAARDFQKADELSRQGFSISYASVKDPSTGKIMNRFSAGLDIRPEIKTQEKLVSFGRLQGVDSKPDGKIMKVREGDKENEKIFAGRLLIPAVSFLLYNDRFFFKAARGK